MKWLLVVLFVPAILLSCEPSVDPTILSEKAKVLQLCYNPGAHGSGVGITSGGDMAVTSVAVSPSWAIVFECGHGRFVVEDSGQGSRSHELWKRLKEGQEVTVTYHEKYIERDGQRQVVGYKFIDAR